MISPAHGHVLVALTLGWVVNLIFAIAVGNWSAAIASFGAAMSTLCWWAHVVTEPR